MNIPHCKAALALIATMLIWGFFPLYLHFLNHIPVDTVMLYRTLWCVVLAWLMVVLRRDWAALNVRQLVYLAVTALALGGFWFMYVWAVPHHYVLDLAMGNFLAPLFMTASGVLLFKEKLAKLEQVALGFAVLGLLILLFANAQLPWVAGLVALFFGSYSILRKHINISPSLAFAVEATVLMAIASVYAMLYPAALTDNTNYDHLLLFGTALLTLIPMTLYGIALRGLKFTTVSMGAYLAPSIAFLTGIFYFKEAISPYKLAAFICVWIGLAIYSYNLRRK